jgi:hypothetical protein
MRICLWQAGVYFALNWGVFFWGEGGISVLHGISNYRYLIETDDFSQKQIANHFILEIRDLRFHF